MATHTHIAVVELCPWPLTEENHSRPETIHASVCNKNGEIKFVLSIFGMTSCIEAFILFLEFYCQTRLIVSPKFQNLFYIKIILETRTFSLVFKKSRPFCPQKSSFLSASRTPTIVPALNDLTSKNVHKLLHISAYITIHYCLTKLLTLCLS